MKVKQQSEAFLLGLQTRKRNRVKPATISLYVSALNNHILPMFGDRDITEIKNGEMRALVASLVEKKLKPSSIQVISTVLKSLVKSLTDDEGNVVSNIKWNSDFVDSPLVDPREQKTPTVTPEVLKQAITGATGQYKVLYALLAGSGLRISEAFGIKIIDDGKSSYWNKDTATLHIRQQMYRGKEQDTKTKSGVRDVDICRELNDYVIKHGTPNGNLLFANSEGSPFELTGALYSIAHKDGIPGYHSLRRWRITHLRTNQVPDGLIKYWVGHGSGNDITSRYDKSATDMQWRKDWAEKIRLGFELPEGSVETEAKTIPVDSAHDGIRTNAEPIGSEDVRSQDLAN